jgi:hypothetical protein
MVIRPSELEELASRLREAIREELKASSGGLPFRAFVTKVIST